MRKSKQYAAVDSNLKTEVKAKQSQIFTHDVSRFEGSLTQRLESTKTPQIEVDNLVTEEEVVEFVFEEDEAEVQPLRFSKALSFKH